MKHVVMFSGGVGSWAAAKRVAQTHGTEGLTLLFTDTLIEDEDLYRFIDEAAANIGVPVTRIAEGRDPWQVFFDKRFLGNTRIDPCSAILKREMADKWLRENCDKAATECYVGIDWTEEHRFTSLAARRAGEGWTYKAPLCQPPLEMKLQMLDALSKEGIRPPRLYAMGFSHNNCGGFCIKAGQGHFALLLQHMPERYRYHEQKEQEFRAFIGKNVSILRDRSGDGKTKPLTLRDFRQRIEAGFEFDKFEIGGCGCFVDAGSEPAKEAE
jgi:hypothetical protein